MINEKDAEIQFNKQKTYWNRKCRFSGCVIPGCIQQSIKAHSIQRSGILSTISENGNVLHHEGNPLSNRFDLDEIGIASASTFFGFCNQHDTQLFSQIENQPYSKTSEQDALFAYRACAREYTAKEYIVCVFNELKQIHPIWTNPYSVEMQNLKDVKKNLDVFHRELVKNPVDRDFSFLERRSYSIPGESMIAVNSMFNLQWDFNGREIYDLLDRTIEIYPLFFNIFPQGGNTHVLISCFKEARDDYASVFEHLDHLSQDALERKLSQIVMVHCENFFVSPLKWKSMDQALRARFAKGFMETLITPAGVYLNEPPVVNLFETLR